ncbi:MAG TPA: GAF domain-containing sensor histidine kinase, partial [Labilithrix sp.]|nr:GAF domain-containing sensor histidine kinase [Labilithrix sp.]
MRAIDWSSTALGPREEWSPYLQSSVTFCLNSSFPMAVYWGPEFVLIYNDAYSRFLGDVHPKALGRPAPEFSSQLWDSSLRQHLQQQLDRCVSKRVPFREEEKRVFMLRYGYPEECFFDYSLDPVPADNGTIGGVIEVCVETTYRVIAERRLRTLRELAKRASAGRSADEVYARAVEALSAAPSDVPFALLYRADADGRTASLSAATGIEKGSPAAPLVVKLVESETERSPWPFGAAVRSGKPVVVSTVDDRYHGLKESLWPEPVREALVLPITAAGLGAFAGFFVAGVSPHRKLDDGYRTFFEFAAEHIATALAEVTAYETQYRRAETLGEVDRAKTVFFSNVSHEFRTPLTLILGPLAEALAASDLPAALREPLGLARRNVLRLTKLVNALLEFSRIEAGRENVSYEPTDLSTLTRAIAGNFESIIRSAGLSLRFACEPLPEPVFVDREMWAKIVLNLVSNAFKFTLEGGIEVGTRAVGANFELFVRDTGVGIPEAELTRVFERFHRLDTTRGRTLEGSGIGLALVEELVKLHGGSVRVESALGRGSTFTVAIPFGTAHLPS